MSEKLDVSASQSSPLDSAVISAGPMLVMAPASDCTRLSLRISRKNLSKAAAAFGQDIPKEIGELSSAGENMALCLGPDEWLLLASEDAGEEIATRFAEMREQTAHSLVDVSHRTVAIDISGPAAAMVLNAGCPLNLDTMAVGGCTRTVLDKAEIILMKRAKQHYRVEIVRSFAEYVWRFLASAGREFEI